jgi:hypothetical protein
MRYPLDATRTALVTIRVPESRRQRTVRSQAAPYLAAGGSEDRPIADRPCGTPATRQVPTATSNPRASGHLHERPDGGRLPSEPSPRQENGTSDSCLGLTQEPF